MWNPAHGQAAAIDYEGSPLPVMYYQFTHAAHGTLTIKRYAKLPGTNQINFKLKLVPHGGGARILETCHLAVENQDAGLMATPQGVGRSTVGYGDIDISNVGGRGIIYVVHHVFGLTGLDLGVGMFIVVNIVSDALDHVCQQTGMGWGLHPASYQATCAQARDGSLARAAQRGWQRVIAVPNN